MITERICKFVSQTKALDIPTSALAVARSGITDFLGVALAGSREPLSMLTVEYANEMGGLPQSTVIGHHLKTSTYLSALVNGTTGHALDYDDVSIAPIAHPSVFLAPAVLAVGERLGSSGLEILAAYVIGYEVAGCIAKPIFQSHYVQGWHSTSTYGSLGAAAAVAWLLKLRKEQVGVALGIAASLACGLRQNFGTMTKPLHAGKAAANGVQAAILARAGFTAAENIIEAPLGFAKVFGHSGEVEWSEIGKGLGTEYVITSPIGLAIKPYPSCHFTHCAIDAALAVKREYGMAPSEIKQVELGTSPFDKQLLIYHRPKTGLEGKFSLEYCVARALVSGEVRLKHFNDAAVEDQEVDDLIGKTKWVEKFPMPVMGTPEGFGTKGVTVSLENGESYHREVSVSRGMPTNPLGLEEFWAKFSDCASVALPQSKVEEALALLSELEKVASLGQLMDVVG